MSDLYQGNFQVTCVCCLLNLNISVSHCITLHFLQFTGLKYFIWTSLKSFMISGMKGFQLWIFSGMCSSFAAFLWIKINSCFQIPLKIQSALESYVFHLHACALKSRVIFYRLRHHTKHFLMMGVLYFNIVLKLLLDMSAN